MKVYWIVPNYPHRHNVQAGIFYKDFAEGLVKAGLDLTVIAPVPFAGLLSLFSKKWKSYQLSPKHEEQNGVKIFRPRYFTHPGEVYRGIPHIFMRRAIQKLKLPAPDVIHGFSGYPAAYAALEYARLQHVPFVSTFVGSDAHDYPLVNEKSKKRFQFLVQHSAKVLAVSHDLVKRIFENAGVQAELLRIPFSPAQVPALSKQEARAKHGLDPQKFILLFAGYLYATKGVHELCDALEQLKEEKEIEALFCGGSSPLVSRVQRLPNATYLGQLPLPEVLEYMLCADALILPSYMEGFPGVIKEAAVLNLPIIATRVGGIPEIASEKTAYLIEPKSVKEIKEAILHVKGNYAEAEAKAKLLKQEVLEHFITEKISAQQLAVYEDLLKNKNKRG